LKVLIKEIIKFINKFEIKYVKFINSMTSNSKKIPIPGNMPISIRLDKINKPKNIPTRITKWAPPSSFLNDKEIIPPGPETARAREKSPRSPTIEIYPENEQITLDKIWKSKHSSLFDYEEDDIKMKILEEIEIIKKIQEKHTLILDKLVKKVVPDKYSRNF
jgi:hypothetical protein